MCDLRKAYHMLMKALLAIAFGISISASAQAVTYFATEHAPIVGWDSVTPPVISLDNSFDYVVSALLRCDL